MQIDAHLKEALSLIQNHPRVAISSDPGSGKSTRIPPALLDQGYRVLVLEPRRVSAMSLASFVCETRAEPLGKKIGYQVRGDSRRSAQTKLLYATEGLLSKYLIDDPSLEAWDIVILDEFHERHLNTDLAWALLNQIQRELRPDLKVVLLSATLNLPEIKRAWPDTAALHIENPPFPLDIEYVAVPKALSDSSQIPSAICQILKSRPLLGDVLVFLPGVFEINRVHQDLKGMNISRDILELYGSQTLGDQQKALRRSPRTRIILATNIAESSITLDGVHTVIDSGLERNSWANPKSGLVHLRTQRISKASATQRAGRAARQGPGLCYRLWSEAEQSALAEFSTAEIHRSDLTEAVLTLEAAGWPPTSKGFQWLEAPQEQRLQEAFTRLSRLDLYDLSTQRASERALKLARFPLSLRGSLYLELLSERNLEPTGADCWIAAWLGSPESRTLSDGALYNDARAVTKALQLQSFDKVSATQAKEILQQRLELVVAAIPDRAYALRTEDPSVARLSCGRGARFQQPDAYRSPYGLALLVRESDPDALITEGIPIPRDLYLKALSRFEEQEAPKAAREDSLWESPPEELKILLVREALFQKHCDPSLNLKPWIEEASAALRLQHSKKTWAALWPEILAWVQGMCDPKIWSRFERACPLQHTLPHSGRKAALIYESPERVVLEARLQEFLGVTLHPRIAEGLVPLTLVLLSPAQRPIQITQRLEDFWTGSYVEIRKEMKARYPKHKW